MAQRTQLRLGQITGSFTTAKINDQITAAATGSIVGADLEDVLSHLAGAIKRIHGADSFSQNAAGEFAAAIQPATDDGAALGGASNNWSDLFLADGAVINLGDDQDVQLTHVADVGILLNSTSQLQFNDDGVFIQSDSDGKLKISADGTAADSINIDSAGGVDVDAADAISLTTTSADGHIELVTAHTAGVAFHLDANANAASEVQIDAGILDIDVTGAGTVDAGGDLTLTGARVILTGSSAADSVLIQSALTVSGDAVFAGNLTVNGTTTTVDTTNLLVKDKLVTLNDGGGANSANGAGIEFEEDGGVTGFIKVANDRAGFEFQAPANGNTLTIDAAATKTITVTGALSIEADSIINQDLTTDADAIFNKVTANGGLVADNITIDGTEIDLSSGDLTLDVAGDIILDADGADIFFDDAGTRFGGITMIGGNNILAVSSSAGNNVALMSQAGSVLLTNSDGSTACTFDLSTTNEIKIMDSEDRVRIMLDTAVGDGLTMLSGSVQLDNGAGAAKLIFSEASANGSNTITLDIPADVGTSYSLTLPSADGSSGQVLKTDGSGNLSFTSIAGDVSKRQISIISTLASGSALNPNSATVSNTAPYTRGALDLSGVAGSTLANLVDVFVNGQLLISGSDANVGAGTADYLVSTHSSASQLKFGFALELEDTVIINKKG
jgi:hypothetical protein